LEETLSSVQVSSLLPRRDPSDGGGGGGDDFLTCSRKFRYVFVKDEKYGRPYVIVFPPLCVIKLILIYGRAGCEQTLK